MAPDGALGRREGALERREGQNANSPDGEWDQVEGLLIKSDEKKCFVRQWDDGAVRSRRPVAGAPFGRQVD